MTNDPATIAKGLTEAELVNEFRSLFNWNGSERLTAKQWAGEHGFSQAYISDVLHGNRGVSDRLASAMGYRRVVIYLQEQDNG